MCPIGFCCPQRQIPDEALNGATTSLCNLLYKKYKMIGFVEVNYLVFWDSFENVPKMWGLDFSFGYTAAVNCVSILARVSYLAQHDKLNNTVAMNNSVNLHFQENIDHLNAAANSYIPLIRNPSMTHRIAEGRCCVYFPVAVHAPLKGTRDDVFFKLCHMHGLTYDSNRRIGTLFYLVDSIIGGGAISVMCISTTRQKCLELALMVMSFVSQHFGKESSSAHILDGHKADNVMYPWDTVRSIVTKLKAILKVDVKKQAATALASVQSSNNAPSNNSARKRK